ncbi:MAG: hypothetical protein H6807_13605 [Planctomycetes bacterium]|nr:hypothetical protein [Planctomycetota bacterium]
MRRTILIILAFLPALVAVALFRSLDHGPKPRLGRLPADDQDGAALDEPLSGFSGTGTFYRRLAPIVLDGEQFQYPSTYYLLDSWRRAPSGDFEIDGLLVVRNEKPRSITELERDLLDVPNSLGAEDRRALLERERARFDSLEAGRALARGGRTVADCDGFELSEGVEALIPAAEAEGGRLRLSTNDARLDLGEGRLRTLQVPADFRAEHPDYLLQGQGLLARENEQEIRVLARPRFEALGLAPGERRTISASGPLVWRPDPLADGSLPDILDRVRLDFGEVEMRDDLELLLDDIRLQGKTATLRIGKRDGSMRGRLSGFVVEGQVVVESPRGRVAGDRARGLLAEDGSMTLVLEGRPGLVEWHDAAGSERKSFVARCQGPIELKAPPTSARESEPLLLNFDGEVALELPYQDETARLTGESLELKMIRVPLNEAGKEPSSAWRLGEGILRGRTSGQAREHSFSSPRLALQRHYDENGLQIDDLLVLDGPVVVERAGGLSRDDPELKSVIEARRRFELVLPASPFADGRATADGHVRLRENRGRVTERSLDCEHIEIVRGPETTAPGESRMVLKSLLARDSVAARDERGSSLAGELVTWDRVTRLGRVEGGPARAAFVDRLGRRQDLAATLLTFNSASGTVSGEGSVLANLHFPALRLADDREKTDDERVEGRPDLAWEIACGRFAARFSGNLPLSEAVAGAEPQSAELVEIDLETEVRVENPEQRVLADALHYDLRTAAGSARGQPVRVRAERQLDDGSRVEDWLEAEQLLIEPDWTLLRGKSRALLHVVAERQEAGRPTRYEDLKIDCQDDVLLKGNQLDFSGRTRLVRGVAAEGGLDVQADGVAVTFAPAPERSGGRGELRRVTGSGQVVISWRDLSGQGDTLTLDYVDRTVILAAKPGENCELRRGRGTAGRSEVVIYDMDSRKITQTRLRVEKSRTEKEKP